MKIFKGKGMLLAALAMGLGVIADIIDDKVKQDEMEELIDKKIDERMNNIS